MKAEQTDVPGIADQARSGAALQQALRETQAIMDNAPVAILFTRERRIARANARFAEIFGYAEDELIDAPARVLYRSEADYEALGREAGPLLARAKPFQTEMFLRREDGVDIWVNLFAYVQNRDDPGEGTIWIDEDRSSVKRTEEALKRAYAEQQLILEHSVVGIAFVRHRLFQRCNRRLEQMYGFGPGELDGQPTRVVFLSEEEHERAGSEVYEALRRGETFCNELIQQRRDGEPFWVRVTGKAIDSGDPVAGSIWNFEDITARKMAEESLRESETLQRALLDSANLIILSTDRTGRIVSCNPAAEQRLGLPAANMLGRRPTDLCFDAAELEAHRQRLQQETGLASPTAMAALCARAHLGQVDEGEWTLRRADGTRFRAQVAISPLHEGESQVKGFLLVAGDITGRKQAESELVRSRDELEARVRERTSELQTEVEQRQRAEQRLRHLALHDALTGLPNRALLRQRLAQAIDQGGEGAVLFVDLDRFKNINDSLGHALGDQLLKEVARRLSASVRAGDSVARLGGDEFVVVAPAVDAPEHAMTIAQKIRDCLRPGIQLGRHELFVTPSIGIALIPRDGSNAATLLRHADTAMYRAKAAGRNTACFFDPAMTAATERYLRTESSLRRHRRRVRVPPAARLGRAQDPDTAAGAEPVGAAVPRARVDRIGRARDRHACDPAVADRLEITETTLMHDGDMTLTTLQWLAEVGFGLTVDDFGTGYSSLAYLKRFPVNKLKIDRSFILDMTGNPDDEAIVRTIIALARTLRLKTTAEGVETPAQRDALQRLGCSAWAATSRRAT